MNLQKLFETQKQLDERIIKEKGLEAEDLTLKRVRALLTELGELSNEEPSFKFWSEDREPRTKLRVECTTCIGTGDINAESNMQQMLEGQSGVPYEECDHCDGTGTERYKNPLLEEYVDCLHFILSIGLNNGYYDVHKDYVMTLNPMFRQSVDHSIIQLMQTDWEYYTTTIEGDYKDGFEVFLGLGSMLGFTTEQVEQAYYAKNKINHDRQANGY
ncbi:dUTP diphosphatase [Geomicrobium sediminis]|uniref:Dimeric dUTPase (All-alpha-NTP-PPase superfamily) n=1 Tax=Geomicrobium sediminis TaxID=1347788 RepID=A0ABS2PF48_9BACL|nr:dimeric dUTPase (all-alpha-NTP-PPase superfamily) [Geomicrobium sediminis]